MTLIVSGSSRGNSASIRVASHIKAVLDGECFDRECSILDLHKVKPNFDMLAFENDQESSGKWGEALSSIVNANSLVFVVPEWHGAIPPALMSFFHLCSSGQLAYKPALLVSVSSGHGGAYPITYMRSFTCKNTKIIYIPEHVIISNVQTFLSSLSASEVSGRMLEVNRRLKYSLDMLNAFEIAMNSFRREFKLNPEFTYGM